MISSFIAHSSLMLIGASCFADCILLTTIDLSLSSITIIPENCFINSFVQKVMLPDSVKKIEDKAFYSSAFPLKWPRNLEEIGSSSFEGNIMAQIVIDLSNTKVSKIGSRSFASSAIHSVFISPYLEIIDDYAFEKSQLTLFDFENAKNLKYIGKYAFAFTNLSDVNIENTKLTEIGEYAFYNSEIASIKLPQNLLTLNPSFQNTSKLLKLSVPQTVNVVMPYSFSNLTGVYIIELANAKILRIPAGCFSGSESLRIITLPLTMNFLDDSSFDDKANINRIFACGNPISAALPKNATVYTSTYWGFPNEIVDTRCRFFDPETLEIAEKGNSGRTDLIIIIIVPITCVLTAAIILAIALLKGRKKYPIGKDSEELTSEKRQPESDPSFKDESDLYNLSDNST